MTAFVDTSALYALLDDHDLHHGEASDALRRLVGTELVTHEFVVIETASLIGRRLPWAATERLLEGILPVIDVSPVDSDLYDAAVSAYRQSSSARISLVDRTSFAFMTSLGIRRAFAYDKDFEQAGFELIA
ncbi:MAG: PIN domain-containing protein [Chloroflexota bacterium]